MKCREGQGGTTGALDSCEIGCYQSRAGLAEACKPANVRGNTCFLVLNPSLGSMLSVLITGIVPRHELIYEKLLYNMDATNDLSLLVVSA